MFVSYAQNFEDVILWRALKGIKGGFYVDIGAQDPLIDSVSRSFYENGWRGIHADANPQYAQRLRDARPDEHVVEAIIGAGATSATFFVVPGTGLSTGDPGLAERYRNSGYALQEHTAPVVPLSHLLSSIQAPEVHWMKIDVEGMEAAVLSSWGTCEVRPWILCIESTDPNSQTPNHEKWEHEVLSRGYEFVYFDGLSRFYIAGTHPELRSHFGPGANIFDGFRLVSNSGLVQTTQAKEALLVELATERRTVAELNMKLHKLWLESVALRTSRDSLLSSTSWRITAPLRAMTLFGRKLKPRQSVTATLRRGLTFVRSKPALHRRAVRLVSFAPFLDRALRKRLAAIQVPSRISRSPRHLAGDQDMTQIDAPLRSPWEQEFMAKFEAAAEQGKLRK